MTDSMKFGPEWLRNLSSEGSTGGVPKYQLAEHRYGREEMLALFDRNVKPPESLVKMQGLYVEKTQMPMALLTMTEEETRQWNRGINSDAVLRVAGKAPLGLPGGLRGRGGSVDRGRGRTRGSGGFHYTRGLSYDETSDGIKDGLLERGFSRGRGYDRSQGGERGWSERNGGDSGDWNGSTSPRKEYSGMKDYSGSRGIDNWRRHRGSGEDEEGWRKSEKWGRSNSWRDEGEGSEGGGPKSSSRTSSWGRGWADEGLRGRSRDDDESRGRGFFDEVPEWAMENPSESGGSFDASGAFHGGTYSDEEDDNIGPRNSRNRLSDDPDSRNRSRSPPPIKKSTRHEHNDYNDEYDELNQSPKDRKLSRSQTAQGNLSESSSKPVPIPVSKSQSSSNIKSETSEPSVASSKRTESHNFDRIRVQHQNFVDKNSTNKDVSDSDELNDLNKKSKKDAGERNSVSDKKSGINSETNTVQEISNLRDKNLIHSKDSLNSNINSGTRLIEEERDRGAPVNRQGSEEDMERMAEVVKDTVVKLFEDEEKPQVDGDRWYYRDPQGVVQGPFRSAEMLEWFMNGYFQLSLFVRREQDKVYVKLGDLMKKTDGKIPFLPGINLPVISPENEPSQPQQPQPPPPPPPSSNIQAQPPNLTQSDLLMQQYHQYQLIQKQILLNQQLAINKLSQSETWNTLSSVQQRNLLMQKLQVAQQPTLEQFAQMEKNPFSQLIAQVQMHQQQQQQQQNKVPMPDSREIGTANNVDPIRQFLQQMNLLQATQPPVIPPINPSNYVVNHHLAQQVHLNSVLNNSVLNQPPTLKVEENKAEDPIQSLLRQLGNQQSQLGNQQKVMVQPDQGDSLWGAPGRPQTWPQGNQPVTNPPNLPLWEIKTEQQILAEQQLRLEEERKQEELRKLQEQEEALKKQRELEEKRREEEKKEELKKLELKRLEEEKIRKQKEDEEKKKAEELKIKQMKEALKKKQEEVKKKLQEEAQKKKEEKEKKKEEERERKRLLEEEKKRLEIEIRKKEEASRKRQEEEEEAKRQEQHKRQMEALKRLQEQQMKSKIAPWSQSNVSMGTSLADIQKLQEKEKKQILREQAAIVQQLAHQNELQMQREAESRSNGLNLKWVEQMPKLGHSVKSLAEIQAEEQLQLSKQQEKERLERLQQQRETSIPPTAGIWGTASQSLSWTNNNSPWGVNPIQPNPIPGFWDEVAPISSKNKAKTPSSPLKTKILQQQQQQQQPQLQQPQPALNQKQGTNSGTNQKQSKPKPKKEEVAILKLFEQHRDEFTMWCSTALQALDTEVDIPTFVTFLRDVDSPFEVKDYVKLYLGEGKEAQEFAKQFLERRSRWRSAQKANIGEDDMNAPAQAINPNSQYAAQEFQEFKGKGKKNKKGKMLKVDSRILGFSVTAAPDRINVGDRDYVDHNL